MPGKVVTGVSYAFVNCADGIVRQVHEGEEVPDASKEELDRLDALGVFGEHPRVAWERHLDSTGAQRRPAGEVERSLEEKLARKDRSGEAEDGGLGSLFPDPTLPPMPEDLARRTKGQLLAFAGGRALDLGDVTMDSRKADIVDKLAEVLADAAAEAEGSGAGTS